MRTQVLSAWLFFMFIFVILSASFAFADVKPFGVYQHARGHAGHHAGVGRTATRNFKSGSVVEKAGRSFRLRKSIYKYFGPSLVRPSVGGIPWIPENSFFASQKFILDLSPVLNL